MSDRHPSINHIALIPDGNRRYATSHHLPTFEGHRRGFEVVKKLGEHIRKLGIPVFTVWAFSSENWKREADEVKHLMEIFERWFRDYLSTAKKEHIRIKHIGRKDRIPSTLLKQIQICEDETSQFADHTLIVALDYGGQDEVERAVKKLIIENGELKMDVDDENKNSFESQLDTAGLEFPNPDLVIRTSGEQRTSGFMIWQAAYSEWIFHDKHLPAFTIEDLDECIAQYDARQRRYGK